MLISNQSIAEYYCATSDIEAQECWSFGIKSCKSVTVNAVAGDDAKLYKPSRCYKSVSEHSKSKGMCWIRLKSDAGILGSLLNAATDSLKPKFYTLKNGKYELIDPVVLNFNCQVRY